MEAGANRNVFLWLDRRGRLQIPTIFLRHQIPARKPDRKRERQSERRTDWKLVFGVLRFIVGIFLTALMSRGKCESKIRDLDRW